LEGGVVGGQGPIAGQAEGEFVLVRQGVNDETVVDDAKLDIAVRGIQELDAGPAVGGDRKTVFFRRPPGGLGEDGAVALGGDLEVVVFVGRPGAKGGTVSFDGAVEAEFVGSSIFCECNAYVITPFRSGLRLFQLRSYCIQQK
jgi:hypothetical protein